MYACQAGKPLIAVGKHRADSSPFSLAFHPPCRKWACPDCRAIRAAWAASHFLSVAGAHLAVWTATLPTTPAAARYVQNAWAHHGEGGRLSIKLTDERTIHVSSNDFLSPRSGKTGGRPASIVPAVRPVDPNEVQKLIRDPALPVLSIRFLRDWTPPDKATNSRRYRIALPKEQLGLFLSWSGLSRADLEGEGSAGLEDIAVKVDEWRGLWMDA